jgi:hypothetical protein
MFYVSAAYPTAHRTGTTTGTSCPCLCNFIPNVPKEASWAQGRFRAKARLSDIVKKAVEEGPQKDYRPWGIGCASDFEQGIPTVQASERQLRQIHAELAAVRPGA